MASSARKVSSIGVSGSGACAGSWRIEGGRLVCYKPGAGNIYPEEPNLGTGWDLTVAESTLPLKLSVSEKQNQLDVTWDRNAPAIAQAKWGLLSISDGSNKPYRVKLRAPGFAHLQAMDFLCRKHMLADISAVLGSLDIVFGEIDR